MKSSTVTCIKKHLDFAEDEKQEINSYRCTIKVSHFTRNQRGPWTILNNFTHLNSLLASRTTYPFPSIPRSEIRMRGCGTWVSKFMGKVQLRHSG